MDKVSSNPAGIKPGPSLFFDDETPTSERTLDALGVNEKEIPSSLLFCKGEKTTEIADRLFLSIGKNPDVQKSPEEVEALTAEMESLIANREVHLLQVIGQTDFSRHHENKTLKSPSHEEFEPLIEGILNFQKDVKELFKQLPTVYGGNKQYNTSLSRIINAMASRIKEQTIASRSEQMEKIKKGTLKPHDPSYSAEAYTLLIQEHIDQFETKPVEKALQELQALLNISMYSWSARKPSDSEILSFRHISDHFTQYMAPPSSRFHVDRLSKAVSPTTRNVKGRPLAASYGSPTRLPLKAGPTKLPCFPNLFTPTSSSNEASDGEHTPKRRKTIGEKGNGLG